MDYVRLAARLHRLACFSAFDLGGAVLFGCAGMAVLGVGFNAIRPSRLVTRPVISLIMVTLVSVQ